MVITIWDISICCLTSNQGIRIYGNDMKLPAEAKLRGFKPNISVRNAWPTFGPKHVHPYYPTEPLGEEGGDTFI